jgi:hypothetical protein
MSGASVSMARVSTSFAAPTACCTVAAETVWRSAGTLAVGLLRHVSMSSMKPCSAQSGWCTCIRSRSSYVNCELGMHPLQPSAQMNSLIVISGT